MLLVEELPLRADHPALDFVNTAEARGHQQAGEALHTPADLGCWGARAGILAGRLAGGLAEDADARPAAAAGRAELRRAIEARELLYRLLTARVTGAPPPADDLEQLKALAADAYRTAALAPGPAGGLTWTWPKTELSTVRHVAVTSAIELLSEPTPRLKRCPGDRCGWFFIDRTKRGNRRWCSMDECGQEAKIARRRARSASKA
jgi:predicted RNA-binding Zn ribbon-like protein